MTACARELFKQPTTQREGCKVFYTSVHLLAKGEICALKSFINELALTSVDNDERKI